jgi:hypothetical protein
VQFHCRHITIKNIIFARCRHIKVSGT